MKKILVVLLCLGLVGCANPSYFRRNSKFIPNNWSKIAVLPFSGDMRFTQVATDTLNLHLLEQDDFVLVEPSTIQFAITKIGVKNDVNNAITILEAQKIGESVNAEVVLLGNITSYNNGLTLNAFATVKMIDTKTGQIVSVSHKPSGLLMGWSEHQAAVAAVRRTAKDMLKALRELANLNKIPQHTKESSDSDT
ncbi:MAG: CsgG/HfaB family protein [Candidatus Omnitrophica bacterium]|nr:CsgG/HfaB family protein [Candidatus Omnitrophota bacterium]